MPEPRLVPHPTHLGASPGSAVGSGRALEHDEGGSVSPRPALSPPNLGSTSRQEKVAPAVQCVSSIAPQSGVNHLPTPWPTPSHSTQAARASGACSVPEQGARQFWVVRLWVWSCLPSFYSSFFKAATYL